jgi:CheY-like chemotaxis protein
MGLPSILVVDDFDDVRLLTKKILSSTPYPVLEASNGLEALKLLRSNHDIALVLLDIMMPVLDGFKTMVEIQKFKEMIGLDIKVCFLTAKRDKENVEKALKLGGNDFMVKPLDPAILKSKIGQLLGEGDGGRFAKAKVEYTLSLANCPFKVNLSMVELSELGAKILSSMEFTDGCEVSFCGPNVKNIIGTDKELKCKVLSCISQGADGYLLEVSFIGLNESELQVIRKQTINDRG